MNLNNLLSLGTWLRRKLDALLLKRHVASTRIESSGFSEIALSLEWAALQDDAIQRAPSKCTLTHIWHPYLTTAEPHRCI